MRAMPANSVDCVVTSPPYWGLRDYDVSGQIGLEPTLGEHPQHPGGDPVDEVLREVGHQGAIVSTYFVLPFPTWRTTADLVAFRFSSRVMPERK